MQVKINSQGKGMGIATFYNDRYSHIQSVTHAQYQMTLISSSTEDIINVYRSEGAPSNELTTDINQLFNKKRRTIIVGDLNICSFREKFHTVVRYFQKLGFRQQVLLPTHQGGGYIDHVYIYDPPESTERQIINVSQQSVYFTDHDILFISKVSENIKYFDSNAFLLGIIRKGLLWL